MSEAEGPALEPGTAVEQAAGSTSILDRIKKRRDEREDILEIGIPSWDDELLAKYRVVDRAEIDKMVRSIRIRQARNGSGKKGANEDQGSQADVNFLINACIGVKAFDMETTEEAELATGFNMGLAFKLGDPDPEDSRVAVIKQVDQDGQEVEIRVSTPPELVSYLVKGNTIALASHAQKVARWMQDTSKPVEDPT